MKETMSPMVAAPRRCRMVPIMTIEMTVMVLAPRGEHVDHRPPVQHWELLVRSTCPRSRESLRLGREPGEGLHDHDIGQRVLRGAGKGRLVALGLALPGLGIADGQDGEGQNTTTSTMSEMASCQLRNKVSGKSTRVATGGELFAEKESHIQNSPSTPESIILIRRPEWRSPWKEAAARAWRKNIAIAGRRLRCASRSACTAMHDIGADADKADGGPDREQELGAMDDGFVRHRVGKGKQVDDAAEQDRLGELESHNREIGDDQADGDDTIWPQQVQHASIDIQKLHRPLQTTRHYSGGARRRI